MTASLITEAQRIQLLYLRGWGEEKEIRKAAVIFLYITRNVIKKSFVTLVSLSLRACPAALSVSPPAVSHACLASALDSWTTLSVLVGTTSFPEPSAEPSHDLFCGPSRAENSTDSDSQTNINGVIKHTLMGVLDRS